MRITRIFQDISLSENINIELNKEASNHIANVLRLPVNTSLIVFNGKGGEFIAHIVDIKKKTVSVKIEAFSNIENESPINIHLAQCISRGEKMDVTIQKSVELGVSEITPIISERCGVKLSNERWGKRLDHWQKIIISACEQCGRNTIPVLNSVINFNEFIQKESVDLKLLLQPYTETTLSEINTSNKDFTILIGPEGGLSDDEIQEAENHHCISLKLGPRILRTETAALTLFSILQAKWGDLG